MLITIFSVFRRISSWFIWEDENNVCKSTSGPRSDYNKQAVLSYKMEKKFYLDLDHIRGAEYKESDERKERKRRKVLRGQRKNTGTRKLRVSPMLLEHFKTSTLLRD